MGKKKRNIPAGSKLLEKIKESQSRSKNATTNATTNAKIGACIMVKNEKLRILVTLESIKKWVDCLIIYDTGSEDNTIEIITNFCNDNNLQLHLKQGVFVDYSISRNVLLDFADDKCDYLLLLDCNDELQSGGFLRNFVDTYTGNAIGFNVKQKWWSGTEDQYFNVRLIRTKSKFKYHSSVHEYIDSELYRDSKEPRSLLHLPEIVIYQDRTKDDDKSAKRFAKDKILLERDIEKDPSNARATFYLAQTCKCLGHKSEAYYYSRKRLELGHFEEEIFHSYLRLGDLSQGLSLPWEESLSWYTKAFEHSARVEPLVQMSIYYRNKRKWHTAWMYCRMAGELDYPHEARLFVDRRAYDYGRWHEVSVVAYHLGHKDIAFIALLRILQQIHNIVDETNLQFFVKPENCDKVLKFVQENLDKQPEELFRRIAVWDSLVAEMLKKNQPAIDETVAPVRNGFRRMRAQRK